MLLLRQRMLVLHVGHDGHVYTLFLEELHLAVAVLLHGHLAVGMRVLEVRLSCAILVVLRSVGVMLGLSRLVIILTGRHLLMRSHLLLRSHLMRDHRVGRCCRGL